MIKHTDYNLYFYDDKSELELETTATVWLDIDDESIDDIELNESDLPANFIDELFTKNDIATNTFELTYDGVEYKFDRTNNEFVVSSYCDNQLYGRILEDFVDKQQILEDNAADMKNEMKREAML